MPTPLRRILGWIYRGTRWVITHLPGGPSLLAWTDPLHLARSLLRRTVQAHATAARGSLLDIGCGELPYRDLLPDISTYVALDMPPNARATVLGDGQSLPFRGSSFDNVLCNQVLEHVPEPWRLMDEVKRILKPGGVLILTTPMTWGLHHVPHDYYRYTPFGLRYLAERSRLKVVDVSPTSGLWATLAQRLVDTVVFTYASGRPHWLTELLSVMLAPVLMAGSLMDRLFGKRGDALDHVLVARNLDE